MLTEVLVPLSTQRPYADDTAASVIRREGFPPKQTFLSHVPHAYDCPCCRGISPRSQRCRGVVDTAEALENAEEQERRRRMQWDVYEERSKAHLTFRDNGGRSSRSNSGHHRGGIRRFYATLQRPLRYETRTMQNPPPPATLLELGKSQRAALPGGELHHHQQHTAGAATDDSDEPNNTSRGSVPQFPNLSDFPPNSTTNPMTGDDTSGAAGYLQVIVHNGRGMRDGGTYRVHIRYGDGNLRSTQVAIAQPEGIGSPSSTHAASCSIAVWDEAFQLPLCDLLTPVEFFLEHNGVDTCGVMIAPPPPVASSSFRRHQDPSAQEEESVEVPSSATADAAATSQWRLVDFQGDSELLVLTPFSEVPPSNPSPQPYGGNEDDDMGGLISLCVSWNVHLVDVADASQLETTKTAISGEAQPSLDSREVTFEIRRVQCYPPFVSDTEFPALHCMLNMGEGECSDCVSLKPPRRASGHYSSNLWMFSEADDTGRCCAVTVPTPAAACRASETQAPPSVVRVLVCVPDDDSLHAATEEIEEGSSLRVIACTALSLTDLPSTGSGTYVLFHVPECGGDAASRTPLEDRPPFGEVSLEWTTTTTSSHRVDQEEGDGGGANDEVARRLGAGGEASSTSDDEWRLIPPHRQAASEDGNSLDHDVFSVVVVRGIDIRRPPIGGDCSESTTTAALRRPRVTVAIGSLAATTLPPSIGDTSFQRRQLFDNVPGSSSTHSVAARRLGWTETTAQACSSVIWNQELRFHLPRFGVSWDGRRVEVILHDDDNEIVSLGTFGILEKIQRALEGREAAVVDGFEVVALTQQGYASHLGHVVLRWRYHRHASAHVVARPLVHLPSAAESPRRFDGIQDEADDGGTIAATTPFGESRQLGESNARYAVSSPPRGSPPRGAGTTAAAHTSPDRLPNPASTTAGSNNDDEDDDIYFYDEDEEEETREEAENVAAQATRSSATASSTTELSAPRDGDYSPRRSSRLVEGGDNGDASDEAGQRGDLNTRLHRYDASPQRPLPPKLQFAIRKGPDGAMSVLFREPGAEVPPPQPAPRDKFDTDTPTADSNVVSSGGSEAVAASAHNDEGGASSAIPVVPVNGPFPEGKDEGDRPYSRWSSDITGSRTGGGAAVADDDDVAHAVDSESAARQLLREELKVKFDHGRVHAARTAHRPWEPSQPWYPPGDAYMETHIPLSRRESEKKQLDAIVELVLKSKFVARCQVQQQQLFEKRSAARSGDVSRSTSVALAEGGHSLHHSHQLHH